MTLNVLYCADNNYASFAGISMFSLLQSNRDMEIINVYFVGDNISDKNIQRLTETFEDFGEGRNLIFIDAKEISEKLNKMSIRKYRNSNAANFRLFFEDFISEDVEKLLYLDCDTLVVGSLSGLLQLDLEDNAVAGVHDCLTGDYKKFINIPDDKAYINSGVLLIDVKNWKAKRYKERMFEIIESGVASMNPDQDCLNRLFDNEVVILPPEYNLQPFHTAYSWKHFEKVLKPACYYSKEEVAAAVESPIIHHTYRFCGQFPWHKSSIHPLAGLWLDIKAQSRFADDAPIENTSMTFKIERVMYRLLPNIVFLRIFKLLQARKAKKHFAAVEKSNKSLATMQKV